MVQKMKSIPPLQCEITDFLNKNGKSCNARSYKI